MHFLKTLFWVALTVGAILFSAFNWTPVTLNLWGGLQADVKLPVLLLAAFLLGFLPLFILHRARVWGLRRRIDGFERQIALMQAPPVPPAPPQVTDPGYPEPAAAPDLAPAPAPAAPVIQPEPAPEPSIDAPETKESPTPRLI